MALEKAWGPVPLRLAEQKRCARMRPTKNLQWVSKSESAVVGVADTLQIQCRVRRSPSAGLSRSARHAADGLASSWAGVLSR